MKEELDKVLRSVWDNENFIYCMTRSLMTNEDKEEMISAIRNQRVKDPTDVMLYALAIHYNEPYEDFRRKIAKKFRL